MKETDPSLTLPFVLIHRFGPAPIPFPFLVAPQRVTISYDAPVSVQQTAAHPYVNEFSGADQTAAMVTLEGTFGYMPRVGFVGLTVTAPGSVMLKTVETTFETFNAFDRQWKKDLGAKQELIMPSRLAYWRVVVRKFSYRISKENPLLYFYTIVMERVADLLSPVTLARTIGGAVTGLGNILGGLVG